MFNDPLVLVDGSYYLFRAYHGMPALSNTEGKPTGAIYGTINMVRRLLIETKPAYFAIVFDAGGKNFRHELYTKYKANRPPVPGDLLCQIEPLKQIIVALGLPLIIIDGVEADDVIATLATRAKKDGLYTIISSGDKDLTQLVSDHVNMVNTLSNTCYDSAGVEAKFGISPKQIGDYLALMGDAVDNIPGVPKVGPKTAAKWLLEYGTLKNIIDNADQFSGKVGEYLRANLDQLNVSRKLVSLRYDVADIPAPQDLLIKSPDKQALRAHYQQWGFNSWLRELNGKSSDVSVTSNVSKHYSTIFTIEQLDTWIARLKQSKLFSLGTQTTSLDYMQARLVGLSFSDKAHHAAYVPLKHEDISAGTQLPIDLVLQKLTPLLEDPHYGKIGQDLKYDQHVFENYGIKLSGIHHDTMLQSYVLNSTELRHDMGFLAKKYLGVETIKYIDLVGSGVKQRPFSVVPIKQASVYAAQDADITFQLHHQLFQELKNSKDLKVLYMTLEMPLVHILSSMERCGVQIAADRLATQSAALLLRMQEIEQVAYELAGKNFNMASPKQIGEVLFNKLNLPILEKTPTGQPSTSESVLQELAYEYELPKLILNYRSFHKLRSTYTEALPKQICSDTGRIHTSYHQAVAATGRLSSSNPNLQNIPIRTLEGRQIRQAFVAPKGYRLLTADYSQIELRIMAHLSEDPGLLSAFVNGEDIHRKTAAEIFGTTINEVDGEKRRAAKAINFGLIYGMSPFGLSRQIGIPLKAAREYIDLYFSKYPNVRVFMERIRSKAREYGYVQTIFHRRLYLPHIRDRNSARRKYAERMAINAPMQGSAADIIKYAMLAIFQWLSETDIDAKMIMQVHDELVFEVKEDQIEQVRQQVRQLMNNVTRLSVPLETTIGIGENWDEAH